MPLHCWLYINVLPSLARETSQQIAQNVNCNNPQNRQQMIICSDHAYKAADQKLNQVYKALQTKITANQNKRLTNAQLAWIKNFPILNTLGRKNRLNTMDLGFCSFYYH